MSMIIGFVIVLINGAMSAFLVWGAHKMPGIKEDESKVLLALSAVLALPAICGLAILGGGR